MKYKCKSIGNPMGNNRNCNEIFIDINFNPVGISMKCKWKSIGKTVEISMKYQYKSIRNTVEISMKYQWKSIENPVEIQ